MALVIVVQEQLGGPHVTFLVAVANQLVRLNPPQVQYKEKGDECSGKQMQGSFECTRAH
jgi:hypothetical protein